MRQEEKDLREAKPEDVDAGGTAHALLNEDDDVADGDRQGDGQKDVADGQQDVHGVNTLGGGQYDLAVKGTGVTQVPSLDDWGWFHDHCRTV